MIFIKVIPQFIDIFSLFSLIKKKVIRYLFIQLTKYFNLCLFYKPVFKLWAFNSFIDILLFGLLKGYTHYLQLSGAGYKFRILESNHYFGLILRLGYSHLIYINLKKKFRVTLTNKTALFFYSNNLWSLNNLISRIKLKKLPNAYKEKGILTKNSVFIIKKSTKLKF